jgi:magnesium transporter
MSEFSMMTAGTPWWVSYPLLMAAMALGAGLMVLGLKRIAGGRERVV